VKHSVARSLFSLTFVFLAFGLIGAPLGVPPDAARADEAPTGRVVYLAGDMPEEQLLALSSALANSGQPAFCSSIRPRRRPIRRSSSNRTAGSRRDGRQISERPGRARKALHFKAANGSPSRTGNRSICGERWFPTPRGRCLSRRAARPTAASSCLAGTLRAPLFVTHGQSNEITQLVKLVDRCQAHDVYLIALPPLAKRLPNLHHVNLSDEAPSPRSRQGFGQARADRERGHRQPWRRARQRGGDVHPGTVDRRAPPGSAPVNRSVRL